MLCISPVWRIRKINSYKNVFTNASIQYSFCMNLLGSEQLHISINTDRKAIIYEYI